MKSRYARNTKVSADRSKGEIEKILSKYGAQGFGYMWKDQTAIVIFQMQGKRIRFNLPLPPQEDYSYTPGRRAKRKTDDMLRNWDQGCREKWRSLSLIIKAKLEAVNSGVTIFEEEFLSHFVTQSGKTVAERLLPELEETLSKAAKVPLLPGV